MTTKSKSKRGRPSRAAASKKALAGVDVETVDPAQILREIVADTSAPASARVAACRALLALGGARSDDAVDELSRRALMIMNSSYGSHTEIVTDIPTNETYRGVGIHDSQSKLRIGHVVKPAIDVVCGMTAIEDLFAYSCDVTKPPEARLFASAKCLAAWELAAERRQARPDISEDKIIAAVAGLGSVRWRDPEAFCSLLDDTAAPNAVRRDAPLER